MPLASMTWFALNAGWLALIVCASWGAGALVLRRVPFHSQLERATFAITLGLSIWAVALLLLGSVRLLRPGIVLTLTLLACAATVAVTFREGLQRPSRLRLTGRHVALAALIAVGWGFLYFQTLFPPTQWDALSHHLVFTREQLRNHGPAVALGTPHAVMPALNHYLFAWAMSLRSDIVAQGIQHLLFMLAAAAMIAWGKRSQRVWVGAGAAAIWLSHPLVLTLSESAYVDVGAGALIFIGIYSLLIFTETAESAHFVVGMAILAAAAGSKVFSLFFLAAGGALGLCWVLQRRLNWRGLLLGCAAAAAICLPWYIFIGWASGGDPIWPLMPRLASGVWSQIPGFDHSRVGLPDTPINFLLVPVKMAMDPIVFGPDFYLSLNPIVALWTLSWVVAFRDRRTRWWSLWALAYTVVWFVSAQYVRYWIPAVPLVGMAIAQSLQWLFERGRIAKRFQIAIWVLLIAYCSASTAVHLQSSFHQKGWPPVTKEQRQVYEQAFLSGYGAVRFINEHARPTDTTYTLNAGYLNYLLDTRTIDFFGVINSPQLQPTFAWPADRQWTNRLDRWGVDWLLIRHRGGEWLRLKEQDLLRHPYWPQFELVYQDQVSWVFHRKSP